MKAAQKNLVIRTLLFVAIMILAVEPSFVWASGQREGNTPVTFGPCVDVSGKRIGADCNDVLAQWYNADPDSEKIIDPVSGKSVFLRDFKRPFLQGRGSGFETVAHSYAGYERKDFKNPAGTYKVEGTLDSDTVVMFFQGGPSNRLLDAYGQALEDKFLVAYVAQTNFVKPNLLSSYNLSVTEARREMAENIDIAETAYKNLKKQFPNKKIALVGHSMGAFLAQKYLAEKGNSFSRVALLAGRLNLQPEFVRRFALGQNIVFDYISDKKHYARANNAVGIKPVRLIRDDGSVGDESYLIVPYETESSNVLLAAVGLPRYITKLQNTDLSNVLYVYSDKDEQVGGLSPEEIAFLKGKGALVKNVGWAADTLGHSRMLLDFEYMNKIAEFLAQ